MGRRPTDPPPRIAPAIRNEDLAPDLMPKVDATAHSVATSPVDLPKTLATAGNPAMAAEAGEEAVEVAAEAAAGEAAVEVVAEAAVVEEAEVVAEAEVVDGDASSRFGLQGAIGSG